MKNYQLRGGPNEKAVEGSKMICLLRVFRFYSDRAIVRVDNNGAEKFNPDGREIETFRIESGRSAETLGQVVKTFIICRQ